ncbi:MAG: hypothetical protein P8130_14480, partial [Deltaproteobacteria bacterium]
VCVQFKGFPLWVLWQLRKMESSIKQQIPEGLQVGREMKSGQGYLVFTYRKRPDGVILSMRYRRLSVFDSRISTMGDAPLLLNQQFILSDKSNPAVLESLRKLFSRCCLAWEKDRIPVGLEEIVDSGLRIVTSHPDRNSFNSIAFNR